MKRFDLESFPGHGKDIGMVERPNGDWIDYGDHAAAIAALTRERDEARAALSLASLALQAAANVVHEAFYLTRPERVELAAQILALTPEDIERSAKEHENG